MKISVLKWISVGALLVAGCGNVNDQSSMTMTESKMVEFRIPANTGKNAWNTKETMVVAKIGDTVRIYNDDATTHILHTNGAPCPHGSPFKTGAFFDCKITKAFDGTTALYDHNVGPAAAFWIKAD